MKFVVKTKKEHVSQIPARWESQYRHPVIRTGDKLEILQQLKAETNLTAERATEIIGNNTWSKLSCDECEQDVDKVVLMSGTTDEYGSNQYCDKCIFGAMKALRGCV